jgi:tetratricopeptide (TPR) repeat protein
LNKYNFFSLLIISLSLLSSAYICRAEKIYYKDGKVVDKEIICRNKGTVWIKHPMGATGIDIDDIDRIENENGTISRYDHKNISKKIEEAISEKKYADAVKWCDFLLKSYPDSIRARYLRAVLNQKIGNLRQAEEDYEFLIDKKSADADIYNNLGALLAKEKKYKEAKSYFEKALEENPGLVEARNNLKALEKQEKAAE